MIKELFVTRLEACTFSGTEIQFVANYEEGIHLNGCIQLPPTMSVPLRDEADEVVRKYLNVDPSVKKTKVHVLQIKERIYPAEQRDEYRRPDPFFAGSFVHTFRPIVLDDRFKMKLHIIFKDDITMVVEDFRVPTKYIEGITEQGVIEYIKRLIEECGRMTFIVTIVERSNDVIHTREVEAVDNQQAVDKAIKHVGISLLEPQQGNTYKFRKDLLISATPKGKLPRVY